MPVRLLLHAERTPRFTDRASREPSWRLLHRIADAAYPHLRTLWATLFAEVRDEVDADALLDALERQSLIEAEAILRTAWTRTLTPLQTQVLMPLLRDTVTQAAAATVPVLEAAVHIQIAFNVVVPEAVAAIDAYAAAQVVGITDAAMLAVRQSIREGFTQGTPLTQLMDQIERHVGLTPRQVDSLARLRGTLAERGISETVAQQQVQEATRRALRLRAEMIARTESMFAANQGAYSVLLGTIDQGLLDETRVKRTWILTPDDRLCARCRAVPARNPNGVGAREPFQTDAGPWLFPPLHPLCRCTTHHTSV